MNITINRSSREPVFHQIFQAIADRIDSGLLTPGTTLPSVRKLAASIPSSLVTVSRAYQLLEKHSYVYTRAGKGTFVRSILLQTKEPAVSPEPVYFWQNQVPDHIPRAQFWNRNKTWASDSMLHLSCAYVHRSLMPMKSAAQNLLDQAWKDSSMLYEYSPIQGDRTLRKYICSCFETRNLQATEDELIITNGTQQGITLIADTFIGVGDVVIMEAPTFMAAIDVFRKRGARIITVPVDSHGMQTKALLELCEAYSPKIIYTIPDYHNPTGVLMSRQRRQELLTIAKDFNCIIVEDDPWSELSLSGDALPPIKSMDADGHVIYLKGFSKFLLPGCRLGVLHAHGHFLQRLVACKGISDLGTSLPTQRLILPLVQPPFIHEYLKALNTTLSARYQLAVSVLESHLPPQVHWTKPRGGPNIWLTLPPEIDTDHLLQESALRNVTFLPGSSCYPDNPEHHHLRISFSYLSELQLKNALLSLCQLIEEKIE